jgi:hypothetical protein
VYRTLFGVLFIYSSFPLGELKEILWILDISLSRTWNPRLTERRNTVAEYSSPSSISSAHPVRIPSVFCIHVTTQQAFLMIAQRKIFFLLFG